ncbi:RDD family protein [Cellulomonas soli]
MPVAPAPAAGYACTACGRPMRPGARFCSTCGEPAPTSPAPPIHLPVDLPPTGRRAMAAAASPAIPTPRAPSLGPAFDGTVPAEPGRRLGAFALDTLAVLLVGLAVLLGTGSGWLAAVAGIELAVGLAVWEARTGLTLGNLALGLRTSREDTPYSLGTRRAAPRALLLGAAHLLAGLGQWALVASTATDHRRRQGWHDTLAKAVVVDVRSVRAADEQPVPTPGATVTSPAAATPPTPPSVAPVSLGAAAASAGIARVGLARPAAPTVYVLTLDTGEALTVTGTGLIGRNPRALAGDPCDHLVTVDDPERSLSRTHARFGIDAGGFWVSDAGSGNGTSLTAPGYLRVAVPPGEHVPVPSGSTVHLGERTFTVHAVS